jgi:hypothetical protein
MTYICDFNWIPLTFLHNFYGEMKDWEYMSQSYLNTTGRSVKCTSSDFLLRLVQDSDSCFIIEDYEGTITDVFMTKNQKEAEEKFMDLLGKKK